MCKSINVTLDHKTSLMGVHGVSEHEVNVAKGVSVSLNTDVTTDQQGEIRWYYNDILIAEITGDQSKIFTDDQYDERLDRLELDHQTGSLTITNTRYTDSGVYHIQFNSSSDREKIFKVTVWGISVGKQKNIAEGGSILLDAGVMKQNEMATWYFNDTLIALVTGDLSKICTDVQWKDSNDRFRDRLKLDYWFSWSLIITNMSSTDSGLYTLKIMKNSFSIMRNVTVTVSEKLNSKSSRVADKADSKDVRQQPSFFVFKSQPDSIDSMTISVLCPFRCRRSQRLQPQSTEIQQQQQQRSSTLSETLRLAVK
ncbi:unnamed protein product [Leuciscus chuanchicus]